MLTISKKSDYGLILMTALSKSTPNTFVSLRTIAKNYHLPYKFLGQIALELKRKNFISSKEGLGGGYQLAKSSNEITLGQIIELLEGPVAPVACMRGKHCPVGDKCQHQKVMNNLALMVNRSLHNTTLAEIAH